MDHTMRKSMKNCAGKWCQKLCAFLFAATWAFGKMWQEMKLLVTFAFYDLLVLLQRHWVPHVP